MAAIIKAKPFSIAPTAGSLAWAIAVVGLLLAALVLVIPHFSPDSTQARLTTLERRLGLLRNAADLYYHQHGHRYPGEFGLDGRTPLGRGHEAEAARAFAAQLTHYTNAAGQVAAHPSAEFRYGPYLQEIPANPFMGGQAARALGVDTTLTDPDAIYPPDGRSGWRYYLQTGRLVANDRTALPDGMESAYQ